jgi:hypothetical protein
MLLDGIFNIRQCLGDASQRFFSCNFTTHYSFLL